MNILRLQRQHVDPVARLHLRCLRTRFQGISGERLLRAYYSAVVEGQGACGFVAAGEDSQVAGFVCGVWDAGLVRRIMVKRSALSLTWNALAQSLARPSLFVDLLGRMLRPGVADGRLASGYELRPIVVAEAARGGPAARLLVAALLEDAAARNFPSVYLVTESDNLPAITFYRKVGFKGMGKIDRDGCSYFWYERSTSVPI